MEEDLNSRQHCHEEDSGRHCQDLEEQLMALMER